MQKKTVRRISLAIMAWAILAGIGPCTIVHRFGPYHGKVVDERGQPVEGALVLTAFFTEMYTLGGFTTHFVDIRETATDTNGDFRIKTSWAWTFRFPQRWDKDCHVTIFAPGHTAFPYHGGLMPAYEPFYSIPSDEYVTVRLPKLYNRGERENNLLSLIPARVPEVKLNNLRKLIELERINIGIVQDKNRGRSIK